MRIQLSTAGEGKNHRIISRKIDSGKKGIQDPQKSKRMIHTL
jgi:hypothetical protein